MTRIPVDIIMRSNFRETRGGDVAQIENSIAHVAEHLDLRYVAADAGLRTRPGAIHHLVNVDRPLDFLNALSRCGTQTVVSAIHHSLARIRAMQRGVGRDRRADFLPEPVRERLAYARRACGAGPASRSAVSLVRTAKTALDPRPMWGRLGSALNQVECVILLAEQERLDLMADSGWTGTNGVIIPNGVPPSEGRANLPWHQRTRNVIVVGRIEPRKRQLEIARVARELGIAVTFVGPARDDAYGSAFRQVVASGGSCEWLGPQSAENTVALISTARVLLNASWVEVQSLVDIEAATAGCWVVTSPTGSSREWLGSAVERMDTDDLSILLARAQERASGDRAPVPTSYNQSWAATGEALLNIYARLANNRLPTDRS